MSRDKLHFWSESELFKSALLVHFYLESGPKLQTRSWRWTESAFQSRDHKFRIRQWTKIHVQILYWAKNHSTRYNRRRSYPRIVYSYLNLSFRSSHSFCCATGHLLLALLYLIFSSVSNTNHNSKITKLWKNKISKNFKILNLESPTPDVQTIINNIVCTVELSVLQKYNYRYSIQ